MDGEGREEAGKGMGAAEGGETALWILEGHCRVDCHDSIWKWGGLMGGKDWRPTSRGSSQNIQLIS